MIGCAICGDPTYYFNGRRYDFCLAHYRQFKEDICTKPLPSWVRLMLTTNQREYRRIKRDSILVSLDGVIHRRDRAAFIEELEGT